MSLGVECGATGTSILLVSENGEKLKRGEFGPANFNLLTEADLKRFFEVIKAELPVDVKLRNAGVGMPGIGDARAKEVTSSILRDVWPTLERVWVGSDAETALACIGKDSDLKLIVIAGTGSNCHAKDANSVSKIGGFGHVIGDRGSSFSIAQRALRLALREFEHKCSLGESPEYNKKLREVDNIPDDCLVKYFMTHIGIPSIAQLVQWSVSTSKTEMARMAVLVIQKWREGNLIAKQVIEEAIEDLAVDCSCLVKKFLKKPVRYSKITIGLTGSLFTKNEDFSKGFKERVSALLDLRGSVQLHFRKLLDTVQGALCMVTEFEADEGELDDLDTVKRISRGEMIQQILPEFIEPKKKSGSWGSTNNSLTLDKLKISEGIDILLKEEATVHTEISNHKEEIEELVVEISKSFERGGRLIFVGAGHSGRIGVLTATEYPPSIKSPPDWVQGVIAGGSEALEGHVEGTDDSVLDGKKAMDDKEVGMKDVVIGISENGTTPFVWGALYKAHNRGAFTALLTFNSELRFKWKPDRVLCLNLVDPEILKGDLRLKFSAATKSFLHILSILSVVNYGEIYRKLGEDSSSTLAIPSIKLKLRERALWIALTIMQDVVGLSEEKVKEVLIRNNFDIQKTVEQLQSEL